MQSVVRFFIYSAITTVIVCFVVSGCILLSRTMGSGSSFDVVEARPITQDADGTLHSVADGTVWEFTTQGLCTGRSSSSNSKQYGIKCIIACKEVTIYRELDIDTDNVENFIVTGVYYYADGKLTIYVEDVLYSMKEE